MANSVTYEQLTKLGEEMAQISDVLEFGQRLKYRFMAFINEHADLSKEFVRRSEFYENLVSTPEFSGLLNQLYAEFRALQKCIDPKKLPPQPRFINQHRSSIDEPDSLSLEEIHGMLSSKKVWPKFEPLNATTGVYVHHTGIQPPWNSDFRQYELVHDLFIQAERAGAITQPEKVFNISEQIVQNIRQLRELATAPLIRWHLAAFYDVRFYSQEPGFLSAIAHISKSVSLVTSELLDYLRLLEEEKKSIGGKRKKFIRSVKNGIVITIKGDEYSFKKKTSNSALLCEEVYNHCRQVGDKVEIIEVYPAIWKGAYETDHLKNWKTVSDAVDNVNELAKKGLPKLLQCTKSHIERLA